MAVFEANLMQRPRRDERFEETMIAQLDRLTAAVFVVAGQSSRADIGEAGRKQDAAAAAWLAETGRRIMARMSAPDAPSPAALADARRSLPTTAAPSLRAAIEARVLLQREIEHVASSPA
jgi:hypothetical protein